MTKIQHERYGFSITSDKSFDQAVTSVKETLKTHGFGVLSEIDIAATLKQKLGLEREPYVILGACNPQFAYEALQAEEQLGLLLPCNVTVRRKNGATLISAIDARTMMSVVENDELATVADEVNTLLRAAIGEAA